MAIRQIDIKLTSQQPVFNSGATWSGNTLTRPTGIQWYEAKVDYLLDPADIPAFMAMFTNGQVYAQRYQLGLLRKGLQASINTTAAFNAGAATISATNANTVSNGQFIQFSNHNKLYQVTSVSASSFTIFPSLRKYVPSGTGLSANPQITGVISDDKITFDEGVVIKASFNVREQW